MLISLIEQSQRTETKLDDESIEAKTHNLGIND